MITQEIAHQLFEYRDGELYWKVKPCRRDPIGTKAGHFDSARGYTSINYKKKRYYLHRIIFLMQHGFLPAEVDHIDGNKANNKIENLRVCSHSENGFNKAAQSNSKSGVKNVSWSKVRNKWIVFIKSNNKQKNIGGFDDLELAELVAVMAREKYHGAYANHG
jgi:HNH endonuclease/AP2 domain